MVYAADLNKLLVEVYNAAVILNVWLSTIVAMIYAMIVQILYQNVLMLADLQSVGGNRSRVGTIV